MCTPWLGLKHEDMVTLWLADRYVLDWLLFK